MPIVLSLIATVLTIIWFSLQIWLTLKDYFDKRELSRGPRGSTEEQGEPGIQGKPGKDAP